jgi:RNA polymerase sigma-70 factor (ECF subfamily)
VDRNEILERLRERIFRYAASRLSRDDAEDIAQEVLLVLQTRYAGVSAIGDLVPLSLEIARRKIWGKTRTSIRRGEKSQVAIGDAPIADHAPDPLEQARRRELLDRLAAAALKLPRRYRELLGLQLQGFTFPEIQKRLKVPNLNTVYTWDFRCRKLLKQILAAPEKQK